MRNTPDMLGNLHDLVVVLTGYNEAFVGLAALNISLTSKNQIYDNGLAFIDRVSLGTFGLTAAQW
ncbi:MAG: hypothetical protein EA348_11875 [Pseudomonadaceae bacterium]|nr:MAG: hypothetical protein EA348_11875 [Pseudomonadaceae bacterium]